MFVCWTSIQASIPDTYRSIRLVFRISQEEEDRMDGRSTGQRTPPQRQKVDGSISYFKMEQIHTRHNGLILCLSTLAPSFPFLPWIALSDPCTIPTLAGLCHYNESSCARTYSTCWFEVFFNHLIIRGQGSRRPLMAEWGHTNVPPLSQ